MHKQGEPFPGYKVPSDTTWRTPFDNHGGSW